MILAPEITSEASNSADTSFTFTSYGQSYKFILPNGGANIPADYPSNYYFSDDAINLVLAKDAEAINTIITFNNQAKILTLISNLYASIFNLAYDYYVGWFGIIHDWVDSNWPNYQFKFEFTGKSTLYPGHETYGDAYGWRFTGLLGEKIDLVLDSQGDIYGSNPIGNVTLSEDVDDFGRWSIHQHDGDDIWIPQLSIGSFGDLKKPYIEGKTLYFWLYNGSTEIACNIPDFTNTVLTFQVPSNNYWYGFRCFKIDNSTVTLNIGSDTFTSPYDTFNGSTQIYYNGPHGSGYFSNRINISFPDHGLNISNNYNINYPAYYDQANYGSYYYVQSPNALGFYQGSKVSGSGDIWLSGLSTTPVSDPVEPPIDQPIPFDNIPTDPADFVDPDDDPDPVPGIDYPTPEPTPVPLPPIPSVVSGNDDLWPDLNDYFETEDDIIDFTFPAVNVEFPDLSILLGNFVSSFTWVSTIITALFNGSDFSVLFSVLAFFFIAAAVLGIYKWWK